MNQLAQKVQNLSPHTSNTWGKSQEGEILGEFSIDTLSFTFPAKEFLQFAGACSFEQINKIRLIPFLKQYFSQFLPFIPFPFIPDLCGMRNFFNHSLHFEHDAGFIAFGGNNKKRLPDGSSETLEEKIQVYFSGVGCSYISKKQLKKLSHFLERNEGKISRIDIAFDTENPQFTVEKAIKLYYENQFTLTGRPPKSNFIDDMGHNSGKTINIGNRANGKMARIYEKGKQLGDENSAWVRWELELHSRDREIPFDIFLNPEKYIAGAYPAFGFMSAVQKIVKTIKEKFDITYSDLLSHARTGYGRLIGYMRENLSLTDAEIVRELALSGCPKRLKFTISINSQTGEINDVQ